MSTTSPASLGHEETLDQNASWLTALRLLREALELLDRSHAPAEIGAQLDQTIHRLETAIHQSIRRPN